MDADNGLLDIARFDPFTAKEGELINSLSRSVT